MSLFEPPPSVGSTAYKTFSASMAAYLARSTYTMGIQYSNILTFLPRSPRERSASPPCNVPSHSASPGMASFLARSTYTMGVAYGSVCSPGPRVVLVGGGGRSRTISARELSDATPVPGETLSVTHSEYVLVDIVPAERVPAVNERERDSLVCRLPLATVAEKLDVPELRDLATLHGIKTTARHLRAVLLSLIKGHVCCDDCEASFAVLKPVQASSTTVLDVTDPSFAGCFRTIAVDTMEPLLGSQQFPPKTVGFTVKAVFTEQLRGDDALSLSVSDIPLDIVSAHLTVPGLRALGTYHGIRMQHRWSKTRCIEALQQHTCASCRPLHYRLEPLVGRGVGAGTSSDWLDNDSEPFLWRTFMSIPTEEYPPRPTTMTDVAKAMAGYCKDISPAAVVQAGCAVCGLLHRRSDMAEFDADKYDLSTLEEFQCARLERSSVDEPVSYRHGPILEPSLTHICSHCDASLVKGHRPKFALANHLWIGDTPDCLKDLTLGEHALISRIRYNQCVVRVSQGHAKMIANVIAFEHPSKKIYDRLPMSKSDLCEVLSIVYTGVSPPSDEDLKRTPVLVRREKVRAALEWLRLNHKDYQDLTIDYDALESYALEGVPVGLLSKENLQDSGNVLAAAKSVFDNTFEEGTSAGPCPYSVAGLTAERHGNMTTSQRKAVGLLYLKNGGQSLAVGHDETPQSIWSNPSLYPQMFPTLFPYGHGGIGQDHHVSKVSCKAHVKSLLMYHDKRFQRDAGFIIVQMNHKLIRQSAKGSFISMKRGNFGKAADAIDKLDPGVLLTIVERLKNGGRFFPKTPEERRCATLMDQVDVVGNHVDGSLAKKKHQRGEIWSLINFLNAPTWFITVSPADAKHPLCIHWASRDLEFKPEIKGYRERQHLVTRNPVACALFFDHLVQLFIKHLCGWGEEGPTRGLFGVPEAYYGTVEEQGRKTLHLHFLLWIRGQLPLHVVREKLMGENSAFLQDVTAYIESCMVGEFFTGSKDEVAARVPLVAEVEDRGIHTILSDLTAVPEGYQDPTLTLPEAPPEQYCETPDECRCCDCNELLSWWERFKHTFDDIFVRSNVHKCFGRKSKKSDPKDDDSASKPARTHATGKGCLNKQGICTARFPRDVFMHSCLDPKTGHLNIRKRESSVNDVTPAVTVAHGCNTDSRCLLSGTSVKAVVGYVTDYISKGWLKTHQVFQTTYDSFSRNQGILDTSEDSKQVDSARRMVMKVVNSLSSKMEIGAPMAALYLLEHPDHYTSHQFVPFYWKNYMNFVQGQWTALMDFAELDDPSSGPEMETIGVAVGPVSEVFDNTDALEPLGIQDDDDMCDGPTVKVEDLSNNMIVLDVEEHDDGGEIADQGSGDSVEQDPVRAGESDETIHLTRSRGQYLARSNTDDYRFRPEKLEEICLYDFIQCAIKHPLSAVRNPRSDLRWFKFSDDHPQFDSQAVALDDTRMLSYVPHFIGPALPRREGGNREDYCCAMLTLFAPWRSGIDLKSADETWEDRFLGYEFTDRQQALMANFNMRYECYDARDDYGALMKAAGKNASGEDDLDDDSDDEYDSVYADNGENDEDDDVLGSGLGSVNADLQLNKTAIVHALRHAGWRTSAVMNTVGMLPSIVLDRNLRSNAWNNIIKVEKLRAWRRRIGAVDDEDSTRLPVQRMNPVDNDAHIVSSTFLSKDYRPPEGGWGVLMQKVILDYRLNPGQEKAFRIIANHACTIAPTQLLMHLGGMGGTGKSTVIKSLCAFFQARDERDRFVLLGPTGTSAALIGGSTYHTFLGVNTAWAKANVRSNIEDVRERLQGVGYILLDEHSMLDCRALCAISAKCCEALNYFEKPFGGLNVILCGDFAQLPPVNGQSLYSRKVSMQQTARQTVGEQEKTIGKHIWLQFTTVVMLTQNMRQTANDENEIAFRRALENLRWHACTPEDIALLRTRIAGATTGLCVDSDGYRNVSVITARNRDKDQINASNSARYAAESGQELVDFYSWDDLKSSEAKRRDPRNRNRVYSTVTKLSKQLQVKLWSQPPSTSEQIPSKLSLCLGLPVMIRYNEATDLCMTRGQEGRVVGWTAQKLPKWQGRRILDTLYVELQNAPRSVKLPHLPRNVVPLTGNLETVEALLPNDEYVTVARKQVPVLPNFAMTDYSAQGKTREWNVVDITNCRTFHGAYTCLSRGTSLSQTLILRDFPDSLLKGSLNGALRQEYRELGYLTTITDLIYEGVLPVGILKTNRWDTIAAYRTWKNTVGVAVESAPAFPVDDDLAPPTNLSRVDHETMHSAGKRKAQIGLPSAPAPKKKRGPPEPILANAAWASPVGPTWDSEDWSCAYDALTFVMHSLWVSDRVKWSRILNKYSLPLQAMISGFEGMRGADPESDVTEVRDLWRSTVRRDEPDAYPSGRGGADIMSLANDLLGYKYYGNRLIALCKECGRREERNVAFSGTLGAFVSVRSVVSTQEYVTQCMSISTACELCGVDMDILHRYSEIVCMEIVGAGAIALDDRIDVPGWGLYRLAGVIYYGSEHFIARSFTSDNKIYQHDGMEGGYSTYEGVLGEHVWSSELLTCRGKSASLAIYAFADRLRGDV